MDGSRLNKLEIDTEMKKGALFVIIAVASIIILCVMLFCVDDLLVLIPGYYQNNFYNEVVTEKNELVNQNTSLLDENEVLEQEITSLLSSYDDYSLKIEKYEQIQSNINMISENLELIIQHDNELLNTRLPEDVTKYVELSHELDVARNSVVSVLQDIVQAQIDINHFKKVRAQFDECLNTIDLTGDDLVISQSVALCNEKTVEMQDVLVLMETDHDVELDQLSEYLILINEQWSANALYYSALAERNYDVANEHDAVFSDRKRDISELDLEEILNEFYVERLELLIDEFDQLSEEEDIHKKKADEWYEKYIQ